MLNAEILDTLSFKNSKITFKKFHLARTIEAYRFVGIAQPEINSELNLIYDRIEQSFADKLNPDECLRIIFSTREPLKYSTEIRKLERLKDKIILNVVQLASVPAPEAAYKWQNRDYWNELLLKKKSESDDILVVAPASDLVETSRFNLFCYDSIQNSLHSPSLASGCLNGVFRRFAMDQGHLILPEFGKVELTEKKIKLTEARKYRLFVGNSVRGLLPAELT